MTDETDVRALVAAAQAELGGIDVWMNNAGLGGNGLVTELSDEEWDRVIDVTLTGTFRCLRAVLPVMYAQGHGAVVNNASVLGWRAQEKQSHYAAAKAGVMALTRCAAMEAAEHGVRINAVSPSLAMHANLAKVTPPGLLEELTATGGVRPGRRALGDRERDGVPGQRPVQLHDRRGPRRVQPASLTL